ncbi:MAG: hypothetical protein ACLUUG_13685 [Lachnospiraceae bacterium]
MNRRGSTIVYTSHYMEEVEQSVPHCHHRPWTCVDNRYHRRIKNMIKTGETITIEAVAADEHLLEKLQTLPHVLDISYEKQRSENPLSSGRRIIWYAF